MKKINKYYKVVTNVMADGHYQHYHLCYTSNEDACKREYLKEGFMPSQLIFIEMTPQMRKEVMNESKGR